MKACSRKNKALIRRFNQALKVQQEKFNLDYGFVTHNYIDPGVAWTDIDFISKHKGRPVVVIATLSCIYHEEYEKKYFELCETDISLDDTFNFRKFIDRLNNKTDEEIEKDRKITKARIEESKEYLRSLTPKELLERCRVKLEKSREGIFLTATLPTKAITRDVIDSFIEIYNANLPLINTLGERQYRQLNSYNDLHVENELDCTECISNAVLH